MQRHLAPLTALYCFLLCTLMSGCGGETSSSSGGAPPDPANGCTMFTPATMINFGATLGNTYDPACVQVSAGASVTWIGAFQTHFLSGGMATSDRLYPDPNSPIKETTSGNMATFTFPNAGTFPYYCVQHGLVGMVGAVLVE